MTNIWIRSAVHNAAGQAIFARMDATNVTAGTPIGGKVNCQAYSSDTQPTKAHQNWEVLDLISLSPPGVFAIRSIINTNAFLRMDSSSGTVDCQFGMSQSTFQSTGAFQLVSLPNSPAFALQLVGTNLFLSVNGDTMTGWAESSGGGIVSGQFLQTPPIWTNGTIEDHTVLYISCLPEVLT